MSGVILITGASRGIGAAAARIAAREGYAVCLNAARSLADARKVADEIVRGGGKAIAVQADVSRRDEVDSLFATVDRELGTLDALINNAAIVGPERKLTEVDADLLRRIFTTNVDSVFFCTAAATRRMSTRHGGKGGAIVNISSAAARMGGVVGWAAYAASKGAVDAFVMNAAKDLGPQGIRICGLRPGMTRTEMLAEIGGDARIQAGISTVSLGRAAEPEEIAEAAVFLASPKASYIHGTTIDVTGGR
ncbi:MAG: SDR family oxidoreductase [Alphaproteobacteria bacterium]|nr:SDR family oxidoreductase [Alphaproteobacteria bacterium]